jgi:lipopolysaccharide/colanic/teichoic acid biosynthesis glycosyltransferase
MIAQHLSPSSNTGMSAPVAISTIPQRSETLKRCCDLFFSLVIAVIAIPVIVMAWVLVRVTSPGPGFYSQVRVGRNGRHYRIYKIRSMRYNCEAGSGAAWSTKRDPRVTRVGKIFRALHIDELPQLLNVLRGDMSLVGPRPERPEFVGPLSEKIPGYTMRLLVRPGVTGLAQIQLPPDTDIESVRTKLVLDRCYVKSGGFWLDLRIMLGTVIYLMGVSYARIRKLMRLPNPLADREMTTESSAQVVGPFKMATLFQTQQDKVATQRSLSLNGEQIACNQAQ